MGRIIATVAERAFGTKPTLFSKPLPDMGELGGTQA
jgi:hypothetical protein